MTSPVSSQPAKLDAFTFPLHGSRLIEASAGTGKTYTIANLYLRLVLGHGNDNTKQPEPLSADRILVVTFTDAATAELRDRIRARIHKARIDFLAGVSGDGFIQKLIDDLDRREERIALLLAAEQQMDEAAVFTIHGFCQRMLKQHAFESGTLFTSELITDETPLLQQTAADFWRRNLYPLDKPLAELSRRLWKTPADLLASIRGWLGQSNLEVERGQLPDSLAAFSKTYIEPLLEIKQLWRDNQDTIEAQVLDGGLGKKAKPLTRLSDMSAFMHSDSLKPSLGSNGKESWEIYSKESLEKATTKAGTVPDHPVFDRIQALQDIPLDIAKAFEGVILSQALAEVRRRVSELKQQRHQMSFDDLLGNLARALQKDHSGLLAGAIREQFPVAMIDEFQDTDPQQYQIFRRVYDATSDDSTGLFMIGDPKQAIYAFRGADIFTYMTARQRVSSHYTLDTNWRSTSDMIASTNTLFSRVEAPFIYGAIPFLPVSPSPVADKSSLMHQGQKVPAAQIWLLEGEEGLVGNTDYEDCMAEATANQINRLLTDANQNQCVIEKEGGRQPLQAGDIAVLVRTGRQGHKIRATLARQGIASVYLSNRESVFSSQEAIDLQRLLAACLSPTDDRTLRSALATPLLNLRADQLDAMNLDEHAWETSVEEFTLYREIWHRQGVLPMLRQLIHRRGVAEQLLSTNDGERRLTDLLHLGELLASASQELETSHALLRWLGEHVQSPDINAEDQQLHLESERNLVKIVTIHKSKGLEYNVVFLPFACNFKEASSPIYHQEASGGVSNSDSTSRNLLDLSGNKEALTLADKERLAEDLRLIYVALTRAVHSCYIGIAPLKKGRSNGDKTDLHKTAFGNLLQQGEVITITDLIKHLSQLAGNHEFITVNPPPLKNLPDYKPKDEVTSALASRTFAGSIQKDWWVTSYSALSRTAHDSHSHAVGSPDSDDSPNASDEQPGMDIEVQGQSAIKPEAPADEQSIFTFPKGARPGTFMHTLFERLTPENSTPEKMPEFVNEQLQLEGLSEDWCDVLTTMLNNCLDAPLDGQQMSLNSLPASKKKVEMEFYLPLSPLHASQLNRLLKQHDRLSAQAAELAFSRVQGMLKGFIDLVFEYQGRWYVLDYKSNWLGAELSDYSRENMEKVMIEHRYDLQYQLYSLALHRLLKSRLADYGYEKHFGGVIYLFLRGVRVDDSERHGIYDCRPDRELIESLDGLFAGETS
ncbi:MAG: exodeoxyribonuclease V subunit beta [Endozoicomonas sp.]